MLPPNLSFLINAGEALMRAALVLFVFGLLVAAARTTSSPTQTMTCEPGRHRFSEWLRPLRFGTRRAASCECRQTNSPTLVRGAQAAASARTSPASFVVSGFSPWRGGPPPTDGLPFYVKD